MNCPQWFKSPYIKNQSSILYGLQLLMYPKTIGTVDIVCVCVGGCVGVCVWCVCVCVCVCALSLPHGCRAIAIPSEDQMQPSLMKMSAKSKFASNRHLRTVTHTHIHTHACTHTHTTH